MHRHDSFNYFFFPFILCIFFFFLISRHRPSSLAWTAFICARTIIFFHTFCTRERHAKKKKKKFSWFFFFFRSVCCVIGVWVHFCETVVVLTYIHGRQLMWPQNVFRCLFGSVFDHDMKRILCRVLYFTLISMLVCVCVCAVFHSRRRRQKRERKKKKNMYMKFSSAVCRHFRLLLRVCNVWISNWSNALSHFCSSAENFFCDLIVCDTGKWGKIVCVRNGRLICFSSRLFTK